MRPSSKTPPNRYCAALGIVGDQVECSPDFQAQDVQWRERQRRGDGAPCSARPTRPFSLYRLVHALEGRLEAEQGEPTVDARKAEEESDVDPIARVPQRVRQMGLQQGEQREHEDREVRAHDALAHRSIRRALDIEHDPCLPENQRAVHADDDMRELHLIVLRAPMTERAAQAVVEEDAEEVRRDQGRSTDDNGRGCVDAHEGVEAPLRRQHVPRSTRGIGGARHCSLGRSAEKAAEGCEACGESVDNRGSASEAKTA
mmetsp:Transcript_100880/g.290011  ORF Transcript_100880/g.290011 Transcript_100880/m.290011 type:complete len:258 (-) Transcript_100880:8-781(-)